MEADIHRTSIEAGSSQAVIPPPDHAHVARDLLAAAAATRRTEAMLLRAQATYLAWLSVGNRAMRCGFTSVAGLALHVLGLQPRTVRERTSLHRACLRFPELERAFLEGRVSACQALATVPLLLDSGDHPETRTEIIQAASALAV